MLVAGIVGPLIYRVVYEPILHQPPYVALIASIGVLIAMEDGFRIAVRALRPVVCAKSLVHHDLRRGRHYAQSRPALDRCGRGHPDFRFRAVQLATRAGVAWRATVSDPPIASSFGVDVIRVRYTSFFIASCLAAVAGVLVGLLNNLVEPGMGNIISYKGLAIIVLGGLGNVIGTLVASVVLGVVESFGTVYLDKSPRPRRDRLPVPRCGPDDTAARPVRGEIGRWSSISSASQRSPPST